MITADQLKPVIEKILKENLDLDIKIDGTHLSVNVIWNDHLTDEKSNILNETVDLSEAITDYNWG